MVTKNIVYEPSVYGGVCIKLYSPSSIHPFGVYHEKQNAAYTYSSSYDSKIKEILLALGIDNVEMIRSSIIESAFMNEISVL